MVSRYRLLVTPLLSSAILFHPYYADRLTPSCNSFLLSYPPAYSAISAGARGCTCSNFLTLSYSCLIIHFSVNDYYYQVSWGRICSASSKDYCRGIPSSQILQRAQDCRQLARRVSCGRAPCPETFAPVHLLFSISYLYKYVLVMLHTYIYIYM